MKTILEYVINQKIKTKLPLDVYYKEPNDPKKYLGNYCVKIKSLYDYNKIQNIYHFIDNQQVIDYLRNNKTTDTVFARPILTKYRYYLNYYYASNNELDKYKYIESIDYKDLNVKYWQSKGWNTAPISRNK